MPPRRTNAAYICCTAAVACLTLTDVQEVEVPTSVRQVNVDLSKTSSRRQPIEPPSAASTPHKPAQRKTTSMLSPRKNTGKSAPVSVQSKWGIHQFPVTIFTWWHHDWASGLPKCMSTARVLWCVTWTHKTDPNIMTAVSA